MLFHLLMLVLHCFTARSCITIWFVVTHVYMGTAHVFFTVFTYLFVHIAHFAFIVLPPLFALLLSCIFTTNVHIAHFTFLVLKSDIFGCGSVLFHVAYPLLPWVVVCITIYMFLLCAFTGFNWVGYLGELCCTCSPCFCFRSRCLCTLFQLVLLVHLLPASLVYYIC